MKKGLLAGITFVVGGLAGAGVSYILTKKKYEKIADEGIANAKKIYDEDLNQIKEREMELLSKIRNLSEKLKGETPMEYAKTKEEIVADIPEEYEEEDTIEINTFEKYGAEDIPQPINRPPYLISPNQYASNEMYNLCTLYKTSDGYIIDDYNDIVEDWESQIGADSINHFGEDDAAGDAVYVRNDIRMIDYEVLLLDNTLEEIQGQ